MRISSPIELCNFGLLKINQGAIRSFNETTLQSEMCARYYDEVRERCLSSYNWQFAITRRALTEKRHTTTRYENESDINYRIRLEGFELLGYRNAFSTVTNDGFLKLVNVYDRNNYLVPDEYYSYESNLILTNLDMCKVKYVRNEEDVNLFDTLFKNYLATSLALELSKYFNDSVNFVDFLLKQSQHYEMKARDIDASQRSFNTWVEHEPY